MKLRSVNTQFWNDPYIADLTAIEKLLFIYLFTNQFVELCGVYEIAIKRVAFDCGLDLSEVESIIGKFSKDGKIHRHGNWIVLMNALKNQAMNPNMIIACNNQFRNLPNEIKSLPFVIEITEKTDYLEPLPKGYLTLTQPFGNPYPTLTQGLPNPIGTVPEENESLNEINDLNPYPRVTQPLPNPLVTLSDKEKESTKEKEISHISKLDIISKEEIKEKEIEKKEHTTCVQKKEKEKENFAEPAATTALTIVPTHPLQIWVRDKLKQVSRLKEQLTAEQCENLLGKYDKPTIRAVLEQMNNWKPLTTKNISVYLTCLNWIKNEKNRTNSGSGAKLNQFERGEVNVDELIAAGGFFKEKHG